MSNVRVFRTVSPRRLASRPRWTPGMLDAGTIPTPADDDFGWKTRRLVVHYSDDEIRPPASIRNNPAILAVVVSPGSFDAISWRRVLPAGRYDQVPFTPSPIRPFPPAFYPGRPANPRDTSGNKPFIVRSPDLPPRLRRFTELLSTMMNSLVGNGYIQKVNQTDWVITSPPFRETRAPTFNDDSSVAAAAGMFWYDSTTGKLYYCVDASPGAALWVAVN